MWLSSNKLYAHSALRKSEKEFAGELFNIVGSYFEIACTAYFLYWDYYLSLAKNSKYDEFILQARNL